MAKVVTAEVKFSAGKVFDGRWGRRQNVLLESVTDGEEIKIWFNEGDPRYVDLNRGDWVKLLKEKDKYTIITDDDEPEEPTPPGAIEKAKPAAIVPAESSGVRKNKRTRSRLTDDQRLAIYQELTMRADILRTCHLEIHKRFTDERGNLIISEETLQKYSVTLYLDIKSML